MRMPVCVGSPRPLAKAFFALCAFVENDHGLPPKPSLNLVRLFSAALAVEN